MDKYHVQIIETVVLLVIFIALNYLNRHLVNKALKKFHFHINRRRIIVKTLNFLVLLIGAGILAGIWGLQQKDILLFISSMLAVVGIAFFAQWSILSNITAGLILFFYHPLKIGDSITVIDKDQPIQGTIHDIGYFFMHVETASSEYITIPNNTILQKVVLIRPSE